MNAKSPKPIAPPPDPKGARPMSADDPYHDNKPYHMAHLYSQKGDVSPLCAVKPRKLNLDRELWTIRKEAVTCKKCLKKLDESAAADRPDAGSEEPS